MIIWIILIKTEISFSAKKISPLTIPLTAVRRESVTSDYFRTYKGYYKNIPLTISQTEYDKGIFILHGVTEEDFRNIWLDYFDLNTDYGEPKRRFSWEPKPRFQERGDLWNCSPLGKGVLFDRGDHAVL